MEAGTDRLITLADDIDGAVREIAPTTLDDALAVVPTALPGSECAAAATWLIDTLGGQVRTWRDDLTGWAEQARASATSYDDTDRRVQTRFTQVPV